MNQAERYQQEFEALMRETQDHAHYANHLRGVENLEGLFQEAARAGISEPEAWQIIEQGSTPQWGVVDLIGAVINRLHPFPGNTDAA